MKSCYIALCATLGSLIGAGLLGMQFNSWPLALIGAVIGFLLGRLAGKFIPFYEWFT